MALVLTGLTVFTDQVQQDLVLKMIATGRTAQQVTVIPGIKNTEALNIIGNTVTVQTGGCGFQTTGSVALTQRNLTVTPLKVNDTICPKDLEKYWTGMKMKPGAAKDVDVLTGLAESYVSKIQEEMEYNIWQGNYSGSSYSKFDGFMEVLCDASSSAGATAGTDAPTVVLGATGSMTSANALGIVNAMVSAASEDVLAQEDVRLFVNYADYRTYTQALIAAGNYIANIDTTNFETYIPGTQIKVTATKGLKNKNARILTPSKNLVIGTDLSNEEEKFDIFYSKDNDEVRVISNWKLGTQVYFPEEVYMSFNEVGGTIA
jgi:hypothetical protein